MTQRFFFLVVALIFLIFKETSGQGNNVDNFHKSAATEQFEAGPRTHAGRLKFSKKSLNSPYLLPRLNRYSKLPAFQKNFQAKELSFFCRQEYRFEKSTSIPLRFRLGSLAYTDYLEKKMNYFQQQ